MVLDHRAHRAVKNQDPVLQRFLEGLQAFFTGIDSCYSLLVEFEGSRVDLTLPNGSLLDIGADSRIVSGHTNGGRSDPRPHVLHIGVRPGHFDSAARPSSVPVVTASGKAGHGLV
ncbi:MAG: hypothetical protein ACOC5M_00920 [Chloroflexota bacterium]